MAKYRNRKTAKGFAKGMEDDLLNQISSQFNDLINETINDLTFGSYNGRRISPILTGFFSSSWKASTSEIALTDERAKVPRWAKIKTVYDPNLNKTVLAPGHTAHSAIRHYIPKKFRLNQSVYIGNTVAYAPEALVSPKRNIIPYLLGVGGLSDKIDRIFTDKRPDLQVGSRRDPSGRSVVYDSF
jgi:hypothetical protein